MRPRSATLLASCTACAIGWATPAGAYPPAMTRDDIICRASSAVGYSYWWGGACWCSSGCSHGSCSNGSCSGNCPNCTHYGSYGADCSGLVTKVWQVPNPISTNTCGHGPYVAATYKTNTSYWHTKSRSSIEQGDSLASSTHVLLYHYGDPWGTMRTYEARGCSYGIVHSLRSCSSDYVAAQRVNIGPACDCSPGEKQSAECGKCGTHHRSCGSDCKWGGWSECTGQGPCSPGQIDERACCDCGTQSRSCSNACVWRDWTACDGPDPAGNPACDTTQPGPCAAGNLRCQGGCLVCVRSYDPVAELCDGVDNDCSGEVDDGHPMQMGEPAPVWAATLDDFSYPMNVQPGESVSAWASFVNSGTHAWQRGQLWLVSQSGSHGKPSPLYDQDSWPAWDVAAVLDADVPPGQRAWFEWRVHAPATASGEVTDTFHVVLPPATPVRCPIPDITVTIRAGAAGADNDRSPSAAPAVAGGCACSAPHEAPSRLGWLLALCTAAGLLRRRQGARV